MQDEKFWLPDADDGHRLPALGVISSSVDCAAAGADIDGAGSVIHTKPAHLSWWIWYHRLCVDLVVAN